MKIVFKRLINYAIFGCMLISCDLFSEESINANNRLEDLNIFKRHHHSSSRNSNQEIPTYLRGPKGPRGPRGFNGSPGSPGSAGPSFNTYAFSTNVSGSYSFGDHIPFYNPDSTSPNNAFPFALFSNITYSTTDNAFVISTDGIYQINLTFAGTVQDDSQGYVNLFVDTTQVGRSMRFSYNSSSDGGITTIASLVTGQQITIQATSSVDLFSDADLTITINRIN